MNINVEKPTGSSRQIHLAINIPQKRWIVASVAIIAALSFISVGAALGVSLKIKSEGDSEYAKQNYQTALAKYKTSQNWWVLDKISPRLQSSDLSNKIAKVGVMIKSGESYSKGTEALDSKDYEAAKLDFLLVVKGDAHYQDAQNAIKDIEKIEVYVAEKAAAIAKTQALAQQKAKIAVAPAAIPAISNTNTNNTTPSDPTGIDWDKFNADLDKKLKDAGVLDNTDSQAAPTVPSSPFPNEPTRDSSNPIIVKVSDSQGNYTTGSTGNGIPFFVTWPSSNPKVKAGSSIEITVSAEDPKGAGLEYRFKNNQNQIVQDWSSNNKLVWSVGTDTGGNPFIAPQIRNSDGVLRYGDCDDSTVLYYELQT